MATPEARLVRRIEKAIKQRWPTAFVVKLADRFTRGLPDLLVVSRGVTAFLEAKVEGGRLSAIQRAVHEEIDRAGGVVFVVFSVEDALNGLEALL